MIFSTFVAVCADSTWGVSSGRGLPADVGIGWQHHPHATSTIIHMPPARGGPGGTALAAVLAL